MIHRQKKRYSEIEWIAIELIRTLKVRINNSTIAEKLQAHPFSSSILSICDSLDEWHIENQAIEVAPKTLLELPVPFIAQQFNRLILVLKISGGLIYYKHFPGVFLIEDEASFLPKTTGIALLVEKTKNSGEKNYWNKWLMEKIEQLSPVLLLICILVTVYYFFKTYKDLQLTSILILKLAGLTFSILLLPVFSRLSMRYFICNEGEKINCNKVIHSELSTFFQLFSWSEIGYFYFSGSLVALVIFPFASQQLLFFLSLLTIPFIVFSIYSQFRILRTWCMLCLLVQATLLAEFLVWILGKRELHLYMTAFHFWNLQSGVIIAILLLPFLTWVFIKKLKKESLDPDDSQHLKLDSQVFKLLLTREVKRMIPPGLGIQMNNSQESALITVVLSLTCNPCRKVYKDLRLLIKKGIPIQLIFKSSESEEKATDLQLMQRLFELYREQPDKVISFLDDWYINHVNEFESMKKAYPLEKLETKENDAIISMNEWCIQNQIDEFPSIFVNGFKLPTLYNFNDLKFLV